MFWNIGNIQRQKGRRIEVMANGFLLWGGLQVAIGSTLLSPLARASEPRTRDHQSRPLLYAGAAVHDARRARNTQTPNSSRLTAANLLCSPFTLMDAGSRKPQPSCGCWPKRRPEPSQPVWKLRSPTPWSTGSPPKSPTQLWQLRRPLCWNLIASQAPSHTETKPPPAICWQGAPSSHQPPAESPAWTSSCLSAHPEPRRDSLNYVHCFRGIGDQQ